MDIEDRRCTDTCCCCLFFLTWVGMAGVASIAISSGDITHLRYGSDYLGNRCGIGPNEGKTKSWYPRIAQDVFEQRDTLMSAAPWEVALYGLCVAECPSTSRQERSLPAPATATQRVTCKLVAQVCTDDQRLRASQQQEGELVVGRHIDHGHAQPVHAA